MKTIRAHRHTRTNKGYALYTAIILTAILILVAYITADLSVKQLLISVSGADSHLAFYNADAGVECALYADLKSGATSAFDPNTPGTLQCNGQTISTNSQTVQTNPTQQSIVGGTGSAAPVALIDVGGGPYTDSLGQTWASDNSYSGGNTNDTGFHAITGSSDPTLYETQRYGSFIYIISGLTPNAPYTVLLKLAETYWSSAGQRIFNIAINGALIVSNLDIFADSGGQFRADDKSFNVNADGGGTIILQFFPSPTSPDTNALLQGIQITSNGVGGGGSIFQLNFPQGCAIVTVNKNSGNTLIQSHGYNSCTGSKRLERGIQIQY